MGTADSSSPLLPVGSVFAERYEIVAELGRGSYATVYRARTVRTGTEVALKVLRPSADDSGAEQFRNEMRLTARLWHPHIVRLFDAGESREGCLYAVFELVPGITLRQVLENEDRLSLAETVHLMTQVLDAVSSAHARGIVHRDLKPENVMITNTGVRRNATVLDFGVGGFISTHTHARAVRRSGALVGTPAYAAPEQLNGEEPTPLSDLYSWGLIFLECITGVAPVAGSSAEDVVLRQLRAERVALPAALMQHRFGPLLRTVTTKQIERRQVTAEELLAGLSGMDAHVAEASAPLFGLDPEEGQRRQLTVVSCRFAAHASNEGLEAEDLDILLHTQQSRCADIATRYGGQVASIMADRMMLAFGYPHAREDDTRRAVRAALQIIADLNDQTAQLAVHIGVHTGLVIVRALRPAGRHKIPHLVGATAQMATRIDAMAPAREVWLSSDTLRTLRGLVDTEPAGECPGVQGSTPVFRLLQGPHRTTFEAGAETPFIGRSAQLDVLFGAWQRSESGTPSVVLVHGEAGIGKSRLLRELRRYVPVASWLESRCVLENQATPLAPLIDLLNSFETPLEALLVRYGFNVAETVPLLAALLSRPTDNQDPLGLSPERQKERTLEILLELLFRVAAENPTAFVLEDLHWADPTTLEYVNLLVARIHALKTSAAASNLCLILTARPDFKSTWADVTTTEVKRLSEREVAAMIAAVSSPGDAVPPALLADIVQRADGIPLFVEEVARLLAERGTTSARPPATGSIVPIPATLRELLMTRLDGLSPSAKETAQLASVLGREFRYEILRAVSTIEATELREDVTELQAANLVFSRRGTRDETFVFRHALVRDAAYESLVRAVRSSLHRRVATTLRSRFPEMEDQRPEVLALHFEHAGEHDTAVDFWHRAGSRLLHRAAYQEARAILDRGLALIGDGEIGPERRQRKAQLLSTLGTVLISTNGYSSLEVENTFAHAWNLYADDGGEIPNDVVYGAWGVHITRSSRDGTAMLLPRLLRIVERTDDPVGVLIASACLGTVHYWQAEYAVSHRYLMQGRSLFDTPEFRTFARTFGYGVGLYSHAYGQLTLWMMGYPDQAAAVRQELLTIADGTRDPYCSAMALAFAMTLAHDCDEPARELELAENLVTLTREQRLPVWLALGLIGRGGAYGRMGGARDAVESVRAGLETLQAVGVLCSYSYFLTYLADAYCVAGDFAAALTTLEESASLCRTLVARPHEPEIFRMYGDVVCRRDGLGNGRAAEAERWYQRGLSAARASAAKSYELRTALSLARLWHEQGRDAPARELLNQVGGWFTEGADTPDLLAWRSLQSDIGNA